MGRTPCCDKNGLKKGPWTPEEDLKLNQYIEIHGPGNWRALPKKAGLQRCGKSCRLRWTNYLRPDIKRGRFSFEEEEAIIQLHSIMGNKWSTIAARLPGRTDNEIKNYWNTHIRKRLLRMGLDPVTHAPRLDFLDLSTLLCNPSNLNLASLLGMMQQQQQQLVNPEQQLLLRLASTLYNNNNNNNNSQFDHLLQNLQENSQLFNNSQTLIPPYTPLPPPFINQPQFMQPNDNGLFTSSSSLENLVPSNFGDDLISHDPNYGYIPSISKDNTTSYQSLLNNKNNDESINNQNFSFDSVLSTPLSSPAPLNSTSAAYYNSSSTTSTEDERDSSYCSNEDMLKFEIPESFDIADFL